MGIFDKLTGKTATLTPKSALVLSAVTVIAADGVIDEAELNDLAKIVRGDRKSIDVAMEVLRANKFPAVIDLAAAALDEKQKLATLAILCDLAMADGILAGEEKAYCSYTWINSVFPRQNSSPSSMRLPSRTISQSSHNLFPITPTDSEIG